MNAKKQKNIVFLKLFEFQKQFKIVTFLINSKQFEKTGLLGKVFIPLVKFYIRKKKSITLYWDKKNARIFCQFSVSDKPCQMALEQIWRVGLEN